MFGGEVRDVKSSFSRVFQRLWETNRDEVLDYSERHGGPIFETNEVNRRFEALQGSDYLFMGLYPHWMLAEIQGILAWSRSMPIRRGRRSSLWWQRAPRAQVVRRRGWIDHTETAAASKGSIAAAVVFMNLAVRDRDLRRSLLFKSGTPFGGTSPGAFAPLPFCWRAAAGAPSEGFSGGVPVLVVYGPRGDGYPIVTATPPRLCPSPTARCASTMSSSE